jgi:hypothetical protein
MELEESRMQTLELRITLQKEIQKNKSQEDTLKIKDDELVNWKKKCLALEEELRNYKEYISESAHQLPQSQTASLPILMPIESPGEVVDHKELGVIEESTVAMGEEDGDDDEGSEFVFQYLGDLKNGLSDLRKKESDLIEKLQMFQFSDINL